MTVASQETAAVVADKAHTFGEVVGCALRALENCPIEINLRPFTVVREHDVARRKPFLLFAAACLLLAPAAWLYYFNRASVITQEMLDGVNADVSKLEAKAAEFTALEDEGKKMQELAAPLILASKERAAWAAILEELGKKIPKRFIWVTDLKPLTDGKSFGLGGSTSSAASTSAPSAPPRPGADPAGPAKIDALMVSGLYLANPPNDKEARVIDEFVDQLQTSEIFKVNERDKSKDVRTTIDGQSWAYGYSFILPLKYPITLP